jgi:hypothetical protein
MRREELVVGAILASAVLLSGCGGSTYTCLSTTCTPQTVQPNILAISPTNVPAGSGSFTLTVTGTGLGMSSQVKFGTVILSPSSVTPMNCPGGGSCVALAVTVPAQDVTSATTVTVSIANSAMVSNQVAFAVTPQSGSVAGAPQLLLFSPMVAPAGGASFQLVVEAQNVAQGATVNFGSLSLSPTSSVVTFYPSSAALSTLMVQVPAATITATGAVAVSVTNPGSSGGTSNQENFFVLNKGNFPIEVSVNNAAPPVPGNAPSTHSSAAIDGFLVAFDSAATNLVTGATSGLSQVYLRRNCLAVAANCTPQTTLVSVAPGGSPGAGGVKGSEKPSMSPDGRFVAFQSDDTNLASGQTLPVEQIYLRDTCESILGPVPKCTPHTILVSASPTGIQGSGASTNPVVGAFGMFVAFQSDALNLVSNPGSPGVQQVYLWRGCNAALLGALPGCQPSIALESVDASGNAGDKDSTNPALDAGLVVAFQSLADNIVANTPGNGFQQIYLRTTCLALASPLPGDLCRNDALAVSVDASGHIGTGDSVTPAVGLFGSTTVFATRAPNLLPAGTSNQQIVAFSTCFAVPPIPCVATPSGGVISVDQNRMPGQGDSFHPTLVGGAFTGNVAFTSQASLVSGVTGQQVYAATFCLPCARPEPTFTVPVLVSADSSGKPMGGDEAAMDLTGQFAAFSSAGPGSASGPTQIFLAAPFF